MRPEYDIVIAGGGMVGASLACALADTPARVALIESIASGAAEQPSYDDRGLALSLASQRILKAVGVWDRISPNAVPVRRIHVTDRGHFGCVRLDAGVMQLDALGYIVIARELGQVLLSRCREIDHLDVICPARVAEARDGHGHMELTIEQEGRISPLSTRLLIVADGAQSELRRQLDISATVEDYRQTAIVMNVTPERHHEDTAYERFTSSGPFALLPLRDGRCVAVCAVPAVEGEFYLGLEDKAMGDFLRQRFGGRLGRFQQIGRRRAYPLKRITAEQQILNRTVLLGNAAHTIHPNGAQGLNLCLRDIAGLVEQLLPALQGGHDPGRRELLEGYLTARRRDQGLVMGFSHGLARLFSSDLAPLVMARNGAMLLTELIPALKRRVILQGMGLYGRQPAMVRGI